MTTMNKWLLSFLLCIVLGCSSATKGGKSGFRTPGGFFGGVEQPENPKDETTGEYIETRPDGTQVKWTTRIGAAQKNVIAEQLSKLKALRPVMFVGIALFIVGAASLAWPPLKAIVGSATTSVIAMLAGLALTVLPTVVVGNEILILAVGVGAVAVYWWSHRHGELRGKVNILETK